MFLINHRLFKGNASFPYTEVSHRTIYKGLLKKDGLFTYEVPGIRCFMCVIS